MPGIRRYLRSHAALMRLFYDADATYKTKIAAAELDIPYKTFMKYVQGLTPCPAEILAQLYAITGFDPIRQVLTPDGYQITFLPPVKPDKETLEEEIMDDICQLTELCEKCRQALEDGCLTRAEHGGLLESLHAALDEFRQTQQKVIDMAPVTLKVIRKGVV